MIAINSILNEQIIPVDYTEEMKQSYIDYSMSVIVDRALPDVRDGLKPVHRRILYAMKDMGMTPDKPHKKSARIVGEVIGKYHPHGDSAVYDTMVRMAQDFNLNMPLVEGHGNFGSIDGDSAAAMRYTEARLSPVALEFLEDLDKQVVEMQDNFDNTLKEPVVLPSRFPQLLVNGVNGIAVGMATNIPPHNFNEVIKGILRTLEHPDITVKQLMRTIKGPDFPTGGIVANKDELLQMYETGIGKLRLRAKLETEKGTHGRTNVVVTEIPYTYSGNKTRLMEKIIELAKNQKLDEVTDVRDESDKEGIRIVLEVKRGTDMEHFLNKLYKTTPLEDTMSVEFLAIVNGKPERLHLKELIEHYIAFQKEITLKKFRYLLKKAEERKEIVEGLKRATDVIDAIIEAIRGSKDVKTVKACLMHGQTDKIQFRTKRTEKQAKSFDFTERQTQAILDMKLQRLIQLEISKLMEDYKKITEQIGYYEKVLADETVLIQEIKQSIEDMHKKLRKNQQRKTVIDQLEAKEIVKIVQEEERYILIDRFGYIKSTDPQNIKRANEETINEFPFVLPALNTERICIFTDKGNFHQVKVGDLPKTKINEKGIPIENVSRMNKERIIAVNKLSDVTKATCFIITKFGQIKIVEGTEFETNRLKVLATKLAKQDEVVSVHIIESPPEHVALLTKQDKGLKFNFKEIPVQKRNSKGVSGITLDEGDEVEGVYLINKNQQKKIQWKNRKMALHSIRARKRNSKAIPLP